MQSYELDVPLWNEVAVAALAPTCLGNSDLPCAGVSETEQESETQLREGGSIELPICMHL
jgi:hypothetical protein